MNTRIMAGLVSLSLLGCVSHHPTTPLQADQRWVTGQLDNGLTYHLYPDHHQPVSIRFYVHAGSHPATRISSNIWLLMAVSITNIMM